MRTLTTALLASVLTATAFGQLGYYNLGNLHCIGDSLTDGAGSSPGIGGYRKPLYNDLTRCKYTFTFVGNNDTWPGGSWPEGKHDGHGGWSTLDLIQGRDGLPPAAVWVSAFRSDTIVLMCGRNDPWDWSYSYVQYSTLVNMIYQANPNVVVYWSNVFLPADQNAWEQYHCDVQDLALKQVVSEQRALGRSVWYIDSYHALKGKNDIFSDSVHLNDYGYGLLEKIIFNRIFKTTPRRVLPHN